MSIPTVTVTLNIPLELLSGALCSAVEGGSSYWAALVKYTLDEEGILDCESVPDGRARWEFLDIEEDKTHTLDRAALLEGVRVLGEKYPAHLGSLLDEDRSDADTGDALLQCALFGEILYG